MVGVTLCAPACSSSDSSPPPPASQPDASDDAASDAGQDVVVSDQTSEPPVQEAGKDVATEPPACVPIDNYTPTADDVKFKALAPVPKGEQILYGNWSTSSSALDGIFTMAPDGTGSTKLFELWRVWSMGVSNAVDQIAVASGEPDQEKHYCVATGDAIQHTWMYDVGSQSLKLIASGNINDECHFFGQQDKNLYVCRRTDFTADFKNTPYNVGRINLQSLAFEFLTTEVDPKMALHGVPNSDESLLYYTFIKMPDNSRTLMRKALPGGTPEVFLDNAGAMVISPDGKQFVYANTTDKSALYITSIDGAGTPLKIANHNGTSVKFSPDGTRVAFLWNDQAANCSHVEIVKIDGSEAATPNRIRDCTKTGENLTELAWVVRP